MHIERIAHDSKILAIVLRNEYAKEGVNFLSPVEYSLQMGVHVRKKGEDVKPHIHKPLHNVGEIPSQEVFHVIYGEVQVDLYEGRKKVESCILRDGDTILLTFSGHSVKFLKDTKMIEVKQGPYRGVKEEKEFI